MANTDKKYNEICEKLGFIPSERSEKVNAMEDDTQVNPFSILELDELKYLLDNGYLNK